MEHVLALGLGGLRTDFGEPKSELTGLEKPVSSLIRLSVKQIWFSMMDSIRDSNLAFGRAERAPAARGPRGPRSVHVQAGNKPMI